MSLSVVKPSVSESQVLFLCRRLLVSRIKRDVGGGAVERINLHLQALDLPRDHKVLKEELLTMVHPRDRGWAKHCSRTNTAQCNDNLDCFDVPLQLLQCFPVTEPRSHVKVFTLFWWYCRKYLLLVSGKLFLWKRVRLTVRSLYNYLFICLCWLEPSLVDGRHVWIST